MDIIINQQNTNQVISLMRGEDITPWQTHYIAAAKTERAERNEPAIQIKLPRIKLSHQLPDVHREHAMLRRMACRKHNLSRTDRVDEVFKEVKEIKGQEESLKQRELCLKDLISQLPLIAIIKQQIKKEQSEINFMQLLKKQEEDRKYIRIEAQQAAQRLATKDHSSFTRLIEKNVILVNNNQESVSDLKLSKKQTQAELIKQILKKEINLMISNRMKILGKTKANSMD